LVVPARAIEYEHHALVAMAPGELIDEELHALGIDVRQHQRVELSVASTVLASRSACCTCSSTALPPAVRGMAGSP
jgi:hypothetical protein